MKNIPENNHKFNSLAAALLQKDTHLCGRSTADNAVRPQRSEFVRISRLIAGFNEL
jgi:homoserine kinase